MTVHSRVIQNCLKTNKENRQNHAHTHPGRLEARLTSAGGIDKPFRTNGKISIQPLFYYLEHTWNFKRWTSVHSILAKDGVDKLLTLVLCFKVILQRTSAVRLLPSLLCRHYSRTRYELE